MITFKQLFPDFKTFYEYIKDYSLYYSLEVYTEAKVLIYYSLLYRYYANSYIAYDQEIFFDKLSLVIAENFREFFLIKDLLDLVANAELKTLIRGIETITNVADDPNRSTDKDSIVDYIGTQQRSISTENLVDRVHLLVQKLKVREIQREINQYQDLFRKIIPRTIWLYSQEGEDD